MPAANLQRDGEARMAGEARHLRKSATLLTSQLGRHQRRLPRPRDVVASSGILRAIQERQKAPPRGATRKRQRPSARRRTSQRRSGVEEVGTGAHKEAPGGFRDEEPADGQTQMQNRERRRQIRREFGSEAHRLGQRTDDIRWQEFPRHREGYHRHRRPACRQGTTRCVAGQTK